MRNSVLLNSNIRCIEISELHEATSKTNALNSNIRCIEILKNVMLKI